MLCVGTCVRKSASSQCCKCVCVFCIALSRLVVSCFVVFCSKPVHVRRESGCCIHVSPRPCSEHVSMGQSIRPHTQGTTSLRSPCSRPLWACYHRMCVIAKDTGLSPQARSCSRTSYFSCLRRFHIQAHDFFQTKDCERGLFSISAKQESSLRSGSGTPV